MSLQELAPGRGLQCGSDSHSTSISRAVHELNELEDECKGGHKGSVFGQMALQGRGKLCRPQPDLKFIPPLVEDLLGILSESHGVDAFFIFIGCADLFW